MSHGQVFGLDQGPVADQKLVFRRRIVICRRGHGFVASARVCPRFSYEGWLEAPRTTSTSQTIYTPLDLLRHKARRAEHLALQPASAWGSLQTQQSHGPSANGLERHTDGRTLPLKAKGGQHPQCFGLSGRCSHLSFTWRG